MKMKLIINCYYFVLIASIAASSVTVNGDNTVIHLEAELYDKFAAQHQIPCFVAGYVLVSNVTVKYTHASPGYSDVENEIPCSTVAMFRVASVSKAIGSGLVASLVEQGKLQWDVDVNTYVPESVFPRKTWKGKNVTITLRQLISHTSGLRHTTEQDLLHDWEFRIVNSTQLVGWFANDPLLAAPSTLYHYSNCGWNLIGAIVEAIEGRPYYMVANEYLRKLNMTAAQMDTREHLILNRGRQYQRVKGSSDGSMVTVPAPITDNLRPFPHWPCGGVLSNIDDLLTYGQQMLQSYNGEAGHFLNSSTVESMWNYMPPVGVNHNRTLIINSVRYTNITDRYTLGWNRLDFPVVEQQTAKDLSQLWFVNHVGAIGGANAIVAIFPKKNFIFAAISNLGGVNDHLPDLAVESYLGV